MSIKNDPKFVELLRRYAEYKTRFYNIKIFLNDTVLLAETDNALIDELELAEEKHRDASSDICKYIDKYVQEEMAKQKAFDRMQHKYEKHNESKKQESKISELQPDDAGSLANIANSYVNPSDLEDDEIWID